MQQFIAKRLSRLHPDRLTWILIALAVLGAAHILVRTSTYGATLGADGVGYVSIAENLIAGEGLQDFRGVKLLPWPPFFPLLLAALGLVGIEPLQAGRLVNAAAFGLIILLSGLYLRRTLRSPLFAVGTALVVMTSVPFTHFASHLMTETVFCLFTLLALMQLDAFLNRRPDRSFLAWAAIFTALASVTRYAGIAVILTGVLLLLLHPPRSLIVRLKDVVVYGVISSMPVVAVFARNWALFGSPDRERPHRNEQSLSDSLIQISQIFERVLFPAHWPNWSTSLPWTVGLAGLLAVAALCIRAMTGDPAKLRISFSLGSALPLGAFVLVYLVFMMAVLPWFSGSGFLPRFLLPCYVPMVLLAAFLLDKSLCIRTEGWMLAVKWFSASVALIGCLAYVGLSVARDLRLTADALESGYFGNAYNMPYWEESETIKSLEAIPKGARVYCNRYGLLHAVLALKTRTSVRGQYPYLPASLNKVNDLIRSIEEGTDEVYIVWLKFDGSPGYDFDDLDLRLLQGVTVTADLSDGVIFRIGSGRRENEGGHSPELRGANVEQKGHDGGQIVG